MNGLIGLGLLIGFILLIIVGMRFIDFAGHFAPRPEKPQPPAEPDRGADRFDREIQTIVATYEEAPAASSGLAVGEARFREVAAEQLEPSLRRIVEEATAAGHQAGLVRNIETGAARYRLEIRRTDHLPNEPLPYILLHAGEKKDVAVLIGGTFPGRKAENSHRTEIDWYETAWKDVDAELVKFTRKVFQHFDD